MAVEDRQLKVLPWRLSIAKVFSCFLGKFFPWLPTVKKINTNKKIYINKFENVDTYN